MPLNVFQNELQLNKVSGSNLLAEFITLETRRELEPKYVPQLFPRLFEDVSDSYWPIFLNLSLVTAKSIAKPKVSLAQFLSHFFSGSL